MYPSRIAKYAPDDREDIGKAKPQFVLMVPMTDKKKKKGKAVPSSKANRCYNSRVVGHLRKDCKQLQSEKMGSKTSTSGLRIILLKSICLLLNLST